MAEFISHFEAAISRPVLKRAMIISLIVGSILALINHGDRLVTGSLDGAVGAKILLTYLVPFTVSLVSSVLAIMDRQKS